MYFCCLPYKGSLLGLSVLAILVAEERNLKKKKKHAGQRVYPIAYGRDS